MDILVDGIFHGLFSSVDPLGMVLRTLMGLLADALAQVVAGMYGQLFEVTTADFTVASLGSIWRITTAVSASVATILLVLAAFRAMVAQSSRYLVEAIPGVALAIIGPQAVALLLPVIAAGFTGLAQSIVAAATPDLAGSMRLLAGVGTNPMYEGLGLMAPLIAAILLFGLTSVFFVLLFCMAAAVVLYALSPFAFAGLVMAPTRAWFRKWATAMFAVLFAKVPIAILLALSVSLFANSAHAGTTQAFVNAGAGLILGVGALLAPLMAYGMFSFMGTIATQPAVPSTTPTRALSGAYYGSQMGAAGVTAGRKAVTAARAITTRTPSRPTSPQGAGGSGAGGSGGMTPAPHEPTAAARSAGAPITHPTTAAPAAAAGPAVASTGGAAGAAAAAGAVTGGAGAIVAAGAAATQVAGSARGTVVGVAGQITNPASTPGTGPAASAPASPVGYTRHGSGLLIPDTPDPPPVPLPRPAPSPAGGVGPPDAHRVTRPPT